MQLSEVINTFQPISLLDMEQVKLMSRTDRKYWFSSSLLPEILSEITENYYLLEISEQRNLPYSTTYFDTPGDEMYNNHHRGKKNRYKIRRRSYLLTAVSFLEIKFKNNKGRTIKQRICSNNLNDNFTTIERDFIKEYSPYSCEDLNSVLKNNFSRLMLVSKTMDERCTIDTALSFESNNSEKSLENLVVVEVKTEGRQHSRIIDVMRAKGVHQSAFSKYCMGRSLMQSDIKINRFKSKHRQIEKTCGLWA